MNTEHILHHCPYSPPIVTKLPAEPWRQEERCGRAGMRDHTVCLQQFHQFIRLVQTSISTRLDYSVHSYILLQRHCYIESSLRPLLEAANQPVAAPAGFLRHENSTTKHEREAKSE